MLKQLESGFNWTVNWNKYQYKKTNQAQNRYLDLLIDSGFRIVIVLSFKDENGGQS